MILITGASGQLGQELSKLATARKRGGSRKIPEKKAEETMPSAELKTGETFAPAELEMKPERKPATRRRRPTRSAASSSGNI